MNIPRRKKFRWECPCCNNYIEIVPPYGVMEVKEYLCAYDGMWMAMTILDVDKTVKPK